MRPLNVLICGSDKPVLRRMAQVLSDEGINVETSSHPIDHLSYNQTGWDFLLIDLDGLNSFLRSMLPGIAKMFPHISMVGISTKTSANEILNSNMGLKLDACLNRVPSVEDLIVCSPRVAAKYQDGTRPLH